ncbi:hypothetical protein cypCar_00012661, partial [Cyprinus carpio]
ETKRLKTEQGELRKTLLFDIQVFLSVSVEGYHDWICSGFISPGSGLCSSAAVRCSSLWCCVQAAVWADVASRSPVDRFVAVTTIVMSTESAAKILTMSALLVSPAGVAVVRRSGAGDRVGVIQTACSTTPAAQTTARSAMLSPSCKLKEAQNLTSQQYIYALAGIGSNPSGFPLPGSGPAPVAGPSSGNPLTIPVQVSLSVSGQGEGPSAAHRPSTLADIAQAMAASSPAAPDANLNPDLCSGLAIDGMATLSNNSIIVFKGHFFWMLNPKTRRAGPARRITEELGIPSPIDTAFTRCNCQGKTYIIKGDNYWSLENGVVEPGYPRSVSQDFGGLTGEITAALPIPATRKRPDSVYFFKKGGTVQKLTFPARSAPTCSGKRSKNSDKVPKNGKQAGIQLSGEINIKLKMKGFPTLVTSALSMPNPEKSDGFEYFVFSWPKVLNVKISGDLPALTAPVSHSSQQNDISKWLNCA